MVDDNDATQGDTSAGTEDDKPKGFSPVIKKPGAVEIGAAPGKLLSPAAKRALQEAAARRKARDISDSDRDNERAGPKGVEPTRYGDWERGGIAYDF